MKNTRRVKLDVVRTGGARTQKGLPQEVRGQLAYLVAYIEFLDKMSEDPRFVWLYGDEEWYDA